MSHEHLPPMALPKVVKIVSQVQLTPRVFRLTLEDKIDCTPGQFVMLWIPRLDEKPFSVESTDPLTITFAVYGAFTQALSGLKPGDKVGWRGPLGHGFEIAGRSVLVVAGGVGLASVSNLVRTLCARNIAVDLVAGARTGDELYDLAHFESLGVRIYPTTDDGSAGFHGYTPAQAAILIESNIYDQVYSCGPEIMMVKLREVLDKFSVPYQFSLERYMKCGIGICDLCSIDGWLCCQDGPVFNQTELRELKEFGHVYRKTTGEEVSVLAH